MTTREAMRASVIGASAALRDRRATRWFHVDAFELGEGEAICVVGPSGAGKSSLLHLVAGILLAARGHVHVGATDWSTLSAHERDAYRARHVACVFQRFNLLGMLSAVENVALPLVLQGVKRDQARARGEQWLERLELSHRTDALCGTLSVGEQQRVALARAFAGKPSILVADEPTASLDAHRRAQLLETMSAFADELEVSLLVVTHDDRVADHFAVQRDVRDIVHWGER